MSTAPSAPRGTKTFFAAFAMIALSALAALPAHALSTDRNQPIKVDADHFKASRPGRTVLTGHVIIAQGTLVATAAKGVAHSNANNAVQLVVLTGSPATVKQALDGGGQMHARARQIDYHIANDTIELTGHARVVQSDKGEFSGAHLVYNTRTGALSGEGGDNGGRVHLVLQPRQPAAASSSTGAADEDHP